MEKTRGGVRSCALGSVHFSMDWPTFLLIRSLLRVFKVVYLSTVSAMKVVNVEGPTRIAWHRHGQEEAHLRKFSKDWLLLKKKIWGRGVPKETTRFPISFLLLLVT